MVIKAQRQPVELPFLTTDMPGPIQAVGLNFLYQLDVSPNSHKTNLWSGQLSPNNDYSPEYAHKAVKLMLAAEDMLAALKMVQTTVEEHLKGYSKDEFTHSMRDWSAAVNDAIAKATAP